MERLEMEILSERVMQDGGIPCAFPAEGISAG